MLCGLGKNTNFKLRTDETWKNVLKNDTLILNSSLVSIKKSQFFI